MLGVAICKLFPSRGEWGLLLGCSAQASPCGGFSCGARALGAWAPVVAAPGAQKWRCVDLVAPRHVRSQFPDQGSSPCPLHLKAGS